MDGSWWIQVARFKSPVRTVAAVLLRSRETQAKRACDKAGEVERLRRDNLRQQRQIERLQRELAGGRIEAERLAVECGEWRRQPPVLPDDPPLPHHEFGPKMIARR